MALVPFVILIGILLFVKPKAQETAEKPSKDSVAPETKDTGAKKPSTSVAQTSVGSASNKTKEGGSKKAKDGKK